MYVAVYVKNHGWRIRLDVDGGCGEQIDICGAASEMVAVETATMLNDYRKMVP